jgi:O-antigen/teichoic acid export membrane protein
VTVARRDVRQLVVGGAIYGVVNALLAATQMTYMLGAAWLLPPEGYGSLSLFAVFTSVTTMLVGLGLSGATQREFFRLPPDSFAALLSSALRAILLTGVFCAVLVIVVPDAIVQRVNLPRPWLLVSVAVALSQAVSQQYLAVQQIRQRISTYSSIVMLQVIGYLILGFLFATRGASRWQTIAGAQACLNFFVGVVTSVLLENEGVYREKFDGVTLRSALRYSAPLVPHQVGSWMTMMLDRFIIAAYTGTASVGVYSAAFQVAQVTNLVSLSANQAIVPFIYRQMGQGKPATSTLRVNTFVIGILGASGVFTAVAFRTFGPSVLPHKYSLSAGLVGWLVVAFFVIGVARLASNFLMYRGRTLELAAIAGVAGIGSTALNLLLVPRFGAVAAAWSACCGAALALALTVYRVRVCEAREADR